MCNLDMACDQIESILSQPEPEGVRSKEDLWKIAEGILDKCTCAEIYTSRRMIDPDCAWCVYHVDFIQAMESYASQQCAEKEKEIRVLERFRLDDAASANNEIGTLHYKLSEANEEINRLNEAIKQIAVAIARN